MISPGTYYNEYLKGKDTATITVHINALREKIESLKLMMEKHRYNKKACPFAYTEILFAREYLEGAKRALIEAGGEYDPSEKEKRDMEFNANIQDITDLKLSVTPVFGGGAMSITCAVEGDKVRFEKSIYKDYSYTEKDIYEFDMDREDFISKLSRIHIGEWLDCYSPYRFKSFMSDGISWSLSAEYSDGRKPYKVCGSNDYPYNFRKLLSLFGDEDQSMDMYPNLD
ncbi:MAG: hypothetical protein E7617_04500 [Ruminococcaceae bacterium]|nr:hypothetical protein [Oscillospiraceae bacterium]